MRNWQRARRPVEVLSRQDLLFATPTATASPMLLVTSYTKIPIRGDILGTCAPLIFAVQRLFARSVHGTYFGRSRLARVFPGRQFSRFHSRQGCSTFAKTRVEGALALSRSVTPLCIIIMVVLFLRAQILQIQFGRCLQRGTLRWFRSPWDVSSCKANKAQATFSSFSLLLLASGKG